MALQLESHPRCEFVAEAETYLYGRNLKIVSRLLSGCIKITEAWFLQMGNICRKKERDKMSFQIYKLFFK